jgi:hypothetical protein
MDVFRTIWFKFFIEKHVHLDFESLTRHEHLHLVMCMTTKGRILLVHTCVCEHLSVYIISHFVF